MRRFNVLADAFDHESDRSGYRWRGIRGVGERLGAKRIGAGVFELDSGELTFTQKLKRREIARKFAAEIESIYADAGR